MWDRYLRVPSLKSVYNVTFFNNKWVSGLVILSLHGIYLNYPKNIYDRKSKYDFLSLHHSFMWQFRNQPTFVGDPTHFLIPSDGFESTGHQELESKESLMRLSEYFW